MKINFALLLFSLFSISSLAQLSNNSPVPFKGELKCVGTKVENEKIKIDFSLFSVQKDLIELKGKIFKIDDHQKLSDVNLQVLQKYDREVISFWTSTISLDLYDDKETTGLKDFYSSFDPKKLEELSSKFSQTKLTGYIFLQEKKNKHFRYDLVCSGTIAYADWFLKDLSVMSTDLK